MEFNHKLQHLRKDFGLTQEQLADKLNISRTAVSKWESGRGFPNIEALKNISRVFSVPVDNLLSGEELFAVADLTDRERKRKILLLLFGLCDIFSISLIFLPLYAKKIDDFIYMVGLFQLPDSQWTKFFYLITLIVSGLIGISELVFHSRAAGTLNTVLINSSFFFHSFAVLVFIATREPYVCALVFFLLILKGIAASRLLHRRK